MKKSIVVIGAGPGGYVAAIRAAQEGAAVTLVEQSEIGGTCLNRGCIPSKLLKTTSDLFDKLRTGPNFGVDLAGDLHSDMKAVQAKKQKVVQAQAEGILKVLKHHKIRYLNARARIAAHGLAVAEGLPEVGVTDLPWDRLILATGSRAYEISSIPFDGERILSSDDALALEELPHSLLIIGGGVIGCEFAFIFAALGSEVTVVEALDRILPLPSVDPDSSKVLQREMRKRKIRIFLNSTVDSVDRGGQRVLVRICPTGKTTSKTDSRVHEVEVEKVLVCVGRSPNTEQLGIQDLGVDLDEKGWVRADERLRTNVDGVYAVGDLLGPSKVMLAHVASMEGSVAAQNAMGAKRIMSYNAIPTAIYTTPEVATVGMTETQARSRGYPVRSDKVLFRNLGKPQVIGQIAGEAKIISELDTGTILGVQMVGPHATDLIAEATLALRLGATVKDVAETVHAHPTLSEIMMETALKALDKPLHG